MTSSSSKPAPPIAEKRPVTLTVHGITRTDEFGWLRADNWQDAMRDPSLLPEDIAAYLKAENAYCAAAMADTEDLQATLVREMRGRIQEDDQTVPMAHGPYLYGRRTVEGGEHFKITRQPRDGGAEEVILDVDAEAQKHDYFVVGQSEICPNHRFLAWSADTSGAEFFTLRFRDTQTDEDLATEIADVASFVWADAETLFYARDDEFHRPTRIYRHRFQSDEADVLVYEEKDPRYFVDV
ncbi:MAG: S9 family peptidase, partial [Pseudomonadota bacterium]